VSKLVTLELGRVAHLELVNPPLNLITEALLQALDSALETLESAPPGDVRAVVVAGTGERAFSAGSHELEQRVSSRLASLPMPTIAAIEGNALGGGLELALSCDLRIASERARLGLPEVRLAVTPGAGGTQRLPRVVGLARAKELILTGRVISAAEAHAIGLVNEVVPAGEARARADIVAAEIADRGPLAVREAKRLLDSALEADVETGLAAEIDASDRLFASEDMVEGARAFFAKRDPEYGGR